MLMFVLAAAAALSAEGPAEMVTAVSSPMNDYNVSHDRSERIRVFARSEADFRKARIYLSEKRDGGWTPPLPISFSDDRYSDSDPWLTGDGKALYFVSNRPTPTQPEKKDLDIWRSRRVGSGWSAPEHLGNAVNSPGPELGPELHGGRLYFASVRKGGKGGLDVYSAPMTGDRFGAAEPLEGPINGPQSDSDFTLSDDGKMAAFWRGGGDGTAKIFMVRRSESDWGEPKPLADAAQIGPFNFTPSFSRDATTLWFASTAERPDQEKGLADIYAVRLR